jgi:hypothetical protein
MKTSKPKSSCEHFDDLSFPCPWPGCPNGVEAETITRFRNSKLLNIPPRYRRPFDVHYVRTCYVDGYGTQYQWTPVDEWTPPADKLPAVLDAIEQHLESLHDIWDSGLVDDEHDEGCHGDDEYCECGTRRRIHDLINGTHFKSAGLHVGPDGKVTVDE